MTEGQFPYKAMRLPYLVMLNIVCGRNSHTPWIVMIALSKYGNDHHCLIWKCIRNLDTITLTKYGNLPNMETITDVINITKYRNDHRNRRDQHYQIWLCLNMETDLRSITKYGNPKYGNFYIWKFPNMEVMIILDRVYPVKSKIFLIMVKSPAHERQYLIIEQDSRS